MKQRIISALFMLPLIIFILIGALPLLIVTFIVSCIALHEFYKGYEAIDVHPNRIIGYVLLTCLYCLVFYGEIWNWNQSAIYPKLLMLWLFACIFSGLCVSLFRPDHNVLDGPITIIGVIYIGFLFAHVVFFDGLPKYNSLIWLIFLSAFGNDIFAYFTGCAIGKHKLCPSISPKKTIEGAVGGIIGSCLFCGIFAYFVYPELLIHCLIIGFVGSFFAMAGDLVASAFKRKMGIKDFGNLIPGHGGILDRFDSVLFTAPFVYYYIVIFIKP